MDSAKCLWCGGKVAEPGDTCNLVCYENLYQAFKLAIYVESQDTPPKALYMQPWAEALLNTQEGTSED